MATNDKSPTALSPSKIATTYVIVAGLWIAFSDAVLDTVTRRGGSGWGAQTAKGIGFVLITAVLLYLMVRRLVDSERASETARVESERRYRTLIEATGEGVGQVDPQGRIVFTNPKLAALVGIPSEKLIGRPMADFVHPDDMPSVLKHMANRRDGVSERYEVRMRSVDGTERTVLVSATPAFDGDGTFRGSFAMIFDISERKRLQQELQHSQKLDAVGRFAGSIAHDFNNVLAIIIGYASMHQNSLPPDNPVRQASEQILAAATRGATLVRHLLAFSRKQALNTDVIDLNTTVQSFGELLPRLMGDDVATTVSCTEGELPIRIGAGQVEQVLMNLAVNSRDAMADVGTFKITTRRSTVGDETAAAQGVAPGDFAVLRVSDSGSGMTPEVLSHIFEPFFTTKGTNHGTGLGLSTVYGIVRQNGGFIHVESAPNEGTTFEVFFPCAGAAVDAAAVENTRYMPTGRCNETILVAEDEAALRELTSLVLRNVGYCVLTAPDGTSALRIAEQHAGEIDLLLTDMRMPGMSGRDLADRLRQLRPEIAVAILSGYSDSSAAVADDNAHLIEKPITPDALLSELRRILDSHRAARNSAA